MVFIYTSCWQHKLYAVEIRGHIKAEVQILLYLLYVHMAADEDYLLHPVAIIFIPVTGEAGVAGLELLQLVLRGRCVPLTGPVHHTLFRLIAW